MNFRYILIIISSFLIKLEASAQLVTANAGADIVQCRYGNIRLNGTATGFGLTYKWRPNIGLSDDSILNPLVSEPATSMVYTLTVTDRYGYVVQDQVTVSKPNVTTPTNILTPNGDGFNDIWDLKCWIYFYDIKTVEIATQGGTQVYYSVGFNAPWDGGGQPEGTYFYAITFHSNRPVLKGFISIIRDL